MSNKTTKIKLSEEDIKYYNDNIKKIIYIQSYYKGYLYRKHNLPNSILYIQYILLHNNISLNNNKFDGRLNSAIDEKKIINILKKNIPNRIFEIKNRHWFDIYINDYQYGNLPINIKITTTKTADNIGNLSILLYSLTNYKMDLETNYNNNKISNILIKYLKNNNINKSLKKDYYFIVINKNNTNEIIVNSFKGINIFTPNISNLPFQIKWNENKNFKYYNIYEQIQKIIKIFKKYNIYSNWKIKFINDMQNL